MSKNHTDTGPPAAPASGDTCTNKHYFTPFCQSQRRARHLFWQTAVGHLLNFGIRGDAIYVHVTTQDMPTFLPPVCQISSMLARSTMRLVSILAFLSSFTGCSKTKPGSDATAEFWAWFTAHSAEYAHLLSYEEHAAAPNDPAREKRVQQAVAETASRLRRINPEFSPFFGYSGGSNKLMITVGGQKQFFAAVDQFVSTAPKIGGWTFVALKPPLNFEAETEIRSGSVTLKLGDMRYTRRPENDGSFAFTVFVPSKVSDDPDGFRRLCTRLLEDSLGERVAATAIHSVDVRQLDAGSQTGLLEFIHVHRDITNKGTGTSE